MTPDTATTAAPTAGAPAVVAPTETQAKAVQPEYVPNWSNVRTKEQIYEQIHDQAVALCRATKDGRIVAPQSIGRELFVSALQGIFTVVGKELRIALPGGYGSIYLNPIRPRQQRTPQGNMIDVPARYALRINPGTAFEEVIKALPAPTDFEGEAGESKEAADPAVETK